MHQLKEKAILNFSWRNNTANIKKSKRKLREKWTQKNSFFTDFHSVEVFEKQYCCKIIYQILSTDMFRQENAGTKIWVFKGLTELRQNFQKLHRIIGLINIPAKTLQFLKQKQWN